MRGPRVPINCVFGFKGYVKYEHKCYCSRF